jgi:dihydropteroate synthase
MRLPTCPLVMGIVNVTPDSFSDGGKFYDESAAVDQALRLVAEGADILDIGGESTRPYSAPVAAEEELRRVIGVVARVCEQTDVPVSIDTSKSLVAAEAIQAGAEILNDVTGLSGDPRTVTVAADTGVGVCAMHMQGTPQDMQDAPKYDDVVQEIVTYLQQRKAFLLESGVDRARVCLDPGIGFGKSHQHNLELVAAAGLFHQTSCPILVGHSRKGFLAKILGNKESDRTAATVGVALALASQGVQIIRVHDVRAVREALLGYEAVGGIDGRVVVLGD